MGAAFAEIFFGSISDSSFSSERSHPFVFPGFPDGHGLEVVCFLVLLVRESFRTEGHHVLTVAKYSKIQ